MVSESEIVIIHLGAGIQSNKNKSKLRKLVKDAINNTGTENHKLLNGLIKDKELIQLKPNLYHLINISDVIETSELTNTGYGSSVNNDGFVECDSSVVITSNWRFYRSSLICDYDNVFPIKKVIMNMIDQLQYKDPMGLTNPVVLVGRGPGDGDNEKLLSPKMKKLYELYKNDELLEAQEGEDVPQDTIGICLIDRNTDNIFSSTSSGGNLFKQKGRVGCAGMIGSGIYNDFVKDKLNLSILCSGNGEDIIQMELARSICGFLKNEYFTNTDRMVCELVSEYVINDLSSTVRLRAIDQQFQEKLYVGVIGYLQDLCQNIRLCFYFHTTETFSICVVNHGREVFRVSQLDGCRYKKGEYML